MKITLALFSLAIATTGAAAQSTLDDPYKYFRDMTKTQEVKTIDPNAPPPPVTTTQSTGDDYKYFRDMTKPHEAKTNPAVPIAPSQPAGTAQSAGQFTKTPLAAETNSSSNSLLDGCVIAAIGRLPKADGLRVTSSSYEYRSATKNFEFWNVRILADLNGRKGAYQWICRVYDNVSAQLIENR